MVVKMACTCSNKDIKSTFKFCPYCGKRINPKRRYPVEGYPLKTGVYAVKTDEFRAPKKGEFYLSGAIPMAYKAKGDLSIAYHIMKVIVP